MTDHADGCAGLFGLNTAWALINANSYTLDVTALRELAQKIRPKLITIGSSLNLFEHPVRDVRAIADEVGARCCLTRPIDVGSSQVRPGGTPWLRARALRANDPSALAAKTRQLRGQFNSLHYVTN